MQLVTLHRLRDCTFPQITLGLSSPRAQPCAPRSAWLPSTEPIATCEVYNCTLEPQKTRTRRCLSSQLKHTMMLITK